MNHPWVSWENAVHLIVGLCLVSSGFGVTRAAAEPPIKESALPHIIQNWDHQLPAHRRFTALSDFNDQAVRDNETGLVWERSPSSIVTGWSDAINFCIRREVAGRKGWHLPMIEQLSSLVDTSGSGGLPIDHPFQNISATFATYWSVTTLTFNQDAAWAVDFTNNGDLGALPKTIGASVWCVRGGQSFDGNTR